MPAKKNLSSPLQPVLGYTPKTLEDTKALFVTKGIIFVIAALVFWLVQPILSGIVVYGFTGVMVISGLTMIATALINEQAGKSFQTACLIMGGLTILTGALPLLWPARVLPVLNYVVILGLALDAFFSMAAYIYLSKIASGIWWAICSGTVGFISIMGIFCRIEKDQLAYVEQFVVQVVTNSIGAHISIWLAFYCLLAGIVFCTSPFLFSMVGKSKREKALKVAKQKNKKSAVRPIAKSTTKSKPKAKAKVASASKTKTRKR